MFQPVLSKHKTSNLPADAMRKGSVQKTRPLLKAARELVTASDSSMGSSGGTTEVTIMMQCSMSLKRLRDGSTKPCLRTANDANTAKKTKIAIK